MRLVNKEILIAVIFLGGFLVFGLTGQARGATYYVDYVAGDDSRTTIQAQSSSTPWKTIGNANSSLADGDTVLLKRGSIFYEDSVGSYYNVSKNSLTFNAYGTGADPIIEGSKDPATITWTLDAGGNGLTYYFTQTVDPLAVWYGDTRLTAVTSNFNSMDAGKYGFDSGSNRVYVRLAGDIDPNTVKSNFHIPRGNAAFVQNVSSGLTMSNITIQSFRNYSVYIYPSVNSTVSLTSMTFKYFSGYSIRTLSNASYTMQIDSYTFSEVAYPISFTSSVVSGSYIRNSTFTASNKAFTTNSTLMINAVTGTGFDFSNNTIACNGYSGIVGFGNGSTVTGNTFVGCGKGCRLVDGAGDAIVISNGAGLSIKGNKIYYGYGGINGAGSITGSSDNIIAYNVVYKTTTNNIHIYYNISGGYWNIYNNTILNDSGYDYVDSQSCSNASAHGIALQTAAVRARIANNLVMVNPTIGGQDAYKFENYSGYDVYMDYNLASCTNGTTSCAGWGFKASSFTVANVAGWIAAVEADGGFKDLAGNVATAASHDLGIDPLFADLNTYNFHLQSTSSAIDSGTDVSLTSDYAGNPIYGTPDIGGYEYQPPYIMGTDLIDTTSSIRIYADGKYRYTTATSSAQSREVDIFRNQNIGRTIVFFNLIFSNRQDFCSAKATPRSKPFLFHPGLGAELFCPASNQNWAYSKPADCRSCRKLLLFPLSPDKS